MNRRMQSSGIHGSLLRDQQLSLLKLIVKKHGSVRKAEGTTHRAWGYYQSLGRWTSVMVDAVGTYTVDDELALAAAVQNFTPAPSRPPPESTPAPEPGSSVPSTPKYVLFT